VIFSTFVHLNTPDIKSDLHLYFWGSATNILKNHQGLHKQ